MIVSICLSPQGWFCLFYLNKSEQIFVSRASGADSRAPYQAPWKRKIFTPFSQVLGIRWHPSHFESLPPTLVVFELDLFSPTGCTIWSCTLHEPRVISSITDARNDCSCYVSESSYDWPICAFPTGSCDTKCVFAMFLSKERVITFKI